MTLAPALPVQVSNPRIETGNCLSLIGLRNDMMNTTIVEVRYLLRGWAHISSHVHNHIFGNPITSLEARVIRAVFRYAGCVIKGDMK